MRLAVTGAHCTGKTTLVEALVRVLPNHVAIEEPYRQLEAEGYLFAAPPGREDFELQLERSIQTFEESGMDQVFDRCPLDFLAYLSTRRRADSFDPEAWLPRVREAIRRLDLIVFVPIEQPDRMEAMEYRRWRRRVDEELGDIVVYDRWDFGVEVLEVSG